MSAKWERLRLSHKDEIPTLLCKYAPTAKGYEVIITDLTYIWSERLDHREVLKRADKDGTTIDPSEDLDQFKVLLQKIGDALQGSPGSSSILNDGSTRDSLELMVSTKLPAPLKPLKWTLYLSKQSQSSSTSHLLLPLLREEAGWDLRQRSLLDQLKQKDWVLGKLFDKIEAMGVDLSTVFPGVSGLRTARKGSTLSQASKYIKGVAPFDEQSWLNQSSKSSSDSGLAANLLAEMTGSDSNLEQEELRPAPDKWWEHLLEHNHSTIAPAQEEPREKPGPKPSHDDLDMDTDTAPETENDEFERQETPPRLKQSKGIDEDTHPATEKKAPISKSPSPVPQKAKGKPSKGLGVIGGKKHTKKPSPSPSPSPPQPSPSPEPKHLIPEPPKRPPPTDDLETETESESESGSEPEPEPEPEPKAPSPSPSPSSPPHKEPANPPPKKSRGLGLIGGKKKQKQATPPPPPPPPPPQPVSEPQSQSPTPQKSPAATPPPKPKRTGKLGVIGGGSKAAKSSQGSGTRTVPQPQVKDEVRTSPDSVGDSVKPKIAPSRSSSPVVRRARAPPVPAEPEKEETEEERADRKREELKRQLAAKSKAPAKKKRKF
ncbi:hypothetical protein ASPWEDRAFT_28074 [Aspergillus wentii DTO 134E9]|uniref:Non-homologous end-joining factor 1 n=1 Tax=Aspergillus wentii DTO 134E9 TaxID=1073089 RepID=A0A1L9RKH7_ASPWE|nr:uncharacterized protein ASPWEDRAFT_28074 [Aspergillus wentii DTO 134E9]OJJ35439.1 hypothetical protein ASPWEDRAFT_28074 [Aspergillus wentii DTO 134E9]